MTTVRRAARVRPLALAGALALAAFACDAPAAVGLGAAAPSDSHVRLASQTAWVGPANQYAFTLRTAVTTPRPPADVELAVTVFRRVTTRSEFALTIQNRIRTPVISASATPLSELTTDPGGAVVVQLNLQDPAQPFDPARLHLPGEGVYPVRVELREVGGGRMLDRFVTHIVYANAPSEGHKLGFAWVLPAHAPPSLRPDGSRRLNQAAATSIGVPSGVVKSIVKPSKPPMSTAEQTAVSSATTRPCGG